MIKIKVKRLHLMEWTWTIYFSGRPVALSYGTYANKYLAKRGAFRFMSSIGTFFDYEIESEG